MVTSPINPMRYWKLEEIQRMLNRIEGYENVIIEFQCQQSDGWSKLNWDCKYGIKEQLVNGQYSWLLKHVFVVEAKTELDAHNLAWQEAAERLITDVWRTSIHTLRKQQTINKTNMTDETTTNMNNTTQTKNDYADGYFDASTTPTNDNTTTEQLPVWKRLTKSFVWMMIIMQCCYVAMNSLMWLYDTLGIEHVMPTLIGIVLWVAVYNYMYGTESKAPHID